MDREEKWPNTECRLKIFFKDMRLNQLDGLMAFWKVAQHRGFTTAAAELGVSPSALSQAIRNLEARLGVRLLNRSTRSVSLTEAGEAYLSRIGPALGDVLEAGDQLHALQGRPSGVLRINAARISIAMVLQPLLAGFLETCPDVRIELTNDEGYVDIVEGGFDAGVRMGESVQKDMVAVPLGSAVAVAVVGSPDYFKRHPAPRHPSELVDHDCVRFRFSGSGAVYKWEFEVDGQLVAYEPGGSLTISDSLFSIEAALDGIGLAYTFAPLVASHVRAKRLKRVLTRFSPTFPGFYLYYPSRRQQPSKLKAFVDYALAHSRAPGRA
jgi:DNA-binding transcriptional LysR family regulator